MTRDEVFALGVHQPPVLCADGLMAMLIIWPSDDGLCGLQVHGEEDIRWVSCYDLEASTGGALKQQGAPTYPTFPGPELNETSNLAHLLLAMDWAKRGHEFLRGEFQPRDIINRLTKIFIDGTFFPSYGYRLELDEDTIDVRTFQTLDAPPLVTRRSQYMLIDGAAQIPETGQHAIRVEFPDGGLVEFEAVATAFNHRPAFLVVGELRRSNAAGRV